MMMRALRIVLTDDQPAGVRQSQWSGDDTSFLESEAIHI
jgi:hypothetical protein